MRLRAQILGFGLVGALLTGLAGGIGFVASSRMSAALEAALEAGQALQASQEADMMHDVIRGDAQLALLGAVQRQSGLIDIARTGLKDHAAKLRSALDKLAGMHIEPDARQALEAAMPVVGRYVEVAESMVAAASRGSEAAAAEQAALQRAFAELEERLEVLSDRVEAGGSALGAAARASVSRTQMSIGLAILVSTISLIAASLWLARRLARPMTQAVDAATHLASGDLTINIRPQGNDETRALLQALQHMRTNLATIVNEVKRNADSVATASAQIAQGNQDLSARTEQQASALQQTAATMKQFGSTAIDNADSARQANQLAQGASQVATEGGDVVARAVQTMRGISDSSRKIAEIIGVIDGIAFQTNILALNAAVEAARAGEQGRGFNVVAGEVRNLAQRSAEAAREIKSLITASVQQVEHGTAQVDKAGATMQEVVTSIRRVTDIVGEISSASAEQASGVNQVGHAVTQMDQATQQNAALVEQSAAAARSLRQQAQQLVQAVAVFKLARDGAAGSPHVDAVA